MQEGGDMKAASIVMKPGDFRDERGIPNFQSLGEVVAHFSYEEIVIMVNHYLMRREDWLTVNGHKPKKSCDNFLVLPRPKLKPNVPLRQQLGRVAHEA